MSFPTFVNVYNHAGKFFRNPRAVAFTCCFVADTVWTAATVYAVFYDIFIIAEN
jgi:hypothetical protein